MIAVLLAGYAVLVGFGLPHRLSEASWASRAPRLAISTWLAAATSVACAALLAAAVLIVPAHVLGDSLVLLVQGCGWSGHGLPALPWTVPRAVGIAAMIGMTLRLGYAAARVVGAQRRLRARHRRDVRLAGRFHPTLDVFVLDHAHPSAFCLPGRGGTVVLTAGALRTLPPAELAAVIAHERTHLDRRHHHLLTCAAVLDRAFPLVPVFGETHRELRRLVELAADDGATRNCAPQTVARAVLRLAAPPTTSALGMGSTAVRQRVQRLLTARTPLHRSAVVARALLVAALLLLPAAVLTLPALSDAAHHCD
ncbi:M56 family metallopeptidase [Candidatus Frankia alpina]|uniref:M56 family metallopeptidase n=1 Tax=Candidatus Frankia alpina TaxID=2699483 RepID=A0A4S5ERB5_9ACTN|nr:M56 family metallopeptidase [Candidatus Frankia alpina]THJ74560.1 M56 family metallopeptidase [Candidatus Frankia alpina]